MRDYMRRRRAGQKPKPRAPSPAALYEIGRWTRKPEAQRPAWAAKVLEGLDLESEEGRAAAYSRYLRYRAEYRAERKLEKQRDREQQETVRCDFCGEASSANRVIVRSGLSRVTICEHCARKAVAIAEAQSKSG
jgi:hypothetical protein